MERRSRTTLHGVSVRVALGLSLVVLSAACACSISSSDKAGGTARTTTVLTMANGNFRPQELQLFADQVASLSAGSMRITFRNEWGSPRADYETQLIRDVDAGKADLGWVGTRAWDTVGVTSFDALHAPLLIDTYALQQKVLESTVPSEMLSGLGPLGIVGLGVLPGPMRKPLGVSRPLVEPAEFQGLTIGIQNSPIAVDALRALGARATAVPAGGSIDALDGIEQQLDSISANSYDAHADYLTANLNLWPRPAVVFMNENAFAKLGRGQRKLLREAMRRATPRALDVVREQERRAAAELCRRGLSFVAADASAVKELRAAVSPVVARLERDARTRSFINAIRAMRDERPVGTDSGPRCSGRGPERSSALPAGTYEVTIRRADARQAGVRPSDPLVRQGPHRFRLELESGHFVSTHIYPGGRERVEFIGTYSTYRDRIEFNGSNGDEFIARWAAEGNEVSFDDISVEGPYAVVMGTHPWVRSGKP